MNSDKDPVDWQVYMIRCDDDSLYTGITTDVERRFRQHADGKGARYFRGRRPVSVAFVEDGHTRASASKREYEIKQLSRNDKNAIVNRYRADER